jgi:hypothetical protein
MGRLDEEVLEAIAEIDDAFASTLDFDSVVEPANWQEPGEYYRTMPAAARAAVAEVTEADERLRRELREIYFPQLLREGTLLCWEQANARYIDALQRKQLYSGRTVAADGTLAKYETLSLVSAQIAISKVSYQRSTGQVVSQIMHWGKDLPRNSTAADIVQAVRSRGKNLKEQINNLFLYALMTYKERQVLMDSPPGTFKLIQGTVFPHEMLSGSGKANTMVTCLELIGALIDDGAYATIVSHSSDREFLVLGRALDPGEYAVLRQGTDVLDEFRQGAHYTTTKIDSYGGRSQIEVFEEFRDRYGPKVVQGILRAHHMSPPYVFFCNEDRLHEAVHMLLADAANTGPRGFPLLVDLADQYCSGAFSAGEYVSQMNAEFARATGGSGIYQSERSTRD